MNEPIPRTPVQRLSWGFVFLALAFIVLLRFGKIWSDGALHSNDYKHIYVGGYLLASHGDPFEAHVMVQAAGHFGFQSINPYVYPPACGLLMQAFFDPDFGVSATRWFFFNLVLALVCVLAGPSWLRIERADTARHLGLIYLIAALPFYRQMTAGQMNVALLASYILALGLLQRNQPILGGGVLGVAAAYKLAPLFMILALIPMRRMRAAISGLVVFSTLCAAAEIWSGGGKTLSFILEIPNMGYGRSTWHEHGHRFYKDPYNQSINSLMSHLFEGEFGQIGKWVGGQWILPETQVTRAWLDLGPWTAIFLTWLCSLSLLAWFALQVHNHRRFHPVTGSWSSPDTRLYLISLLLMLLLPSLMWDHYAVQTLIVIMVLAGSRDLARSPLRVPALAAAFLLLTWWVPHGDPKFRQGLGILVMSLRLWGVLLLLGLVAGGFKVAGRAKAD